MTSSVARTPGRSLRSEPRRKSGACHGTTRCTTRWLKRMASASTGLAVSVVLLAWISTTGPSRRRVQVGRRGQCGAKEGDTALLTLLTLVGNPTENESTQVDPNIIYI